MGVNKSEDSLVKSALSLFRYRGPDFSDTYTDGQVTLGHNRLKIIDLDSRSNQPMQDTSGNILVVFNGEIYNFKKIKDSLSSKYSFVTTSDTEVLLYAYKEYGSDMVKHIKGMYAFAIYDKTKNKIILFRDHVGIKPLYYYFKDDLFIFSSEIKGILSLLRSKNIFPELNDSAIGFYRVLGYISSPHTLYSNIFKVEPASFLEYDLESKTITKKETYRQPYEKIKNDEDFFRIIGNQTLEHLVSDVPVGLFFSGGTDSSLIASILNKNKINLETFSIRIKGKEEDEKHFLAISKKLNLKSHVFDFSVKEFDEIYLELMEKIDEPLCDSSIFPTYYVSKKASEYVKVVLSGEGGDEFFYGYKRDLVLSRLNGFCDYELTLADRLYFYLPPFKGKNYIFEKIFILLKKPLSYYIINMSQSRDLSFIDEWRSVKKEFKDKIVSPLEFDQIFYLENDLLKKIDMATSYNSIEGRVPLLDVEITSNAKEFKGNHLENGVLKSFLKKMLSLFIPKDLVYRGKSGFGLDLRFIFNNSRYFKRDLEKALIYLRDNKIKTLSMTENKNIEYYINKYPNFCFSLVSLYYVLVNNQKIK